MERYGQFHRLPISGTASPIFGTIHMENGRKSLPLHSTPEAPCRPWLPTPQMQGTSWWRMQEGYQTYPVMRARPGQVRCITLTVPIMENASLMMCHGWLGLTKATCLPV